MGTLLPARLELTIQAETKSPEHIDSALALLEKPLKSRLASYQMALLKANLET